MSQSAAALVRIIGNSEVMYDACHLMEQVSPSNTTVLLLGETGTGKKLFARAVHRLSAGRDGRFVAINCAAIPENLLEAELFDYEKGAYKQTKRKIELAGDGSLLIDEIGDTPLMLQANLLRFFQERVMERIGGRELIPVDVRVICATHQDLQALIRAGRFREDLFCRVREVSIPLPPLRNRIGDVVLLVRHFGNTDDSSRGSTLTRKQDVVPNPAKLPALVMSANRAEGSAPAQCRPVP